jgi:hypothetical protein
MIPEARVQQEKFKQSDNERALSDEILSRTRRICEMKRKMDGMKHDLGIV